MQHTELAKLVETKQVSKSKADKFIGKNVRCPSLIPGTLYLMKLWSVKHKVGSDNPYQVVEFIGSGREDNGVRTLFAENPAIKDMKDGDHFYFKAVKSTGEFYEFAAYMFENCVCVTSGAVRVTCYAIAEEGQQAPAKPAQVQRKQVTPPAAQSPVKPDKMGKREMARRTYNDEGEMCPGVLVWG